MLYIFRYDRSFRHQRLELYFRIGRKAGIEAAHANACAFRLPSTIATITDQSAVPRMHNPPHPGEVLRDGTFAGTGITVTEFARRLGVTRVALSRVLNGKAAISAEMAVRLGLRLAARRQRGFTSQATYDLWHAQRALKRQLAKIERIKTAVCGKFVNTGREPRRLHA